MNERQVVMALNGIKNLAMQEDQGAIADLAIAALRSISETSIHQGDIMQDKPKGRAVLVTTEYRGVFFGYAEETSGDTIKLTGLRNCIYWDSKTGGFAGLAETGPGQGCRIGARVDGELRKVTGVFEVTPTAAEAWESAPCYKS